MRDIRTITHGEVLAMSPKEQRAYTKALLDLRWDAHERQLDREFAKDREEDERGDFR